MFPKNTAKFSRKPLLKNTSEKLLLEILLVFYLDHCTVMRIIFFVRSLILTHVGMVIKSD